MYAFKPLTAAAAVALSCAVFSTGVLAQAYPAKPVRMILPFPAGAPSDLVGRFIGQKMGEQMGHNMIPDNRVGAGGNLALGLTATSPADGYTVVVSRPPWRSARRCTRNSATTRPRISRRWRGWRASKT